MEVAVGNLLITGGSRGIGAATAVLAAQRGYNVVVSYRRRAEAAQQTVAAIEATGREARAFQADLSSAEDIERLWRQARETFGTIHGLVNNAATLEQQCQLIDMEPARLERVVSVNVVGAMLCAREAVRHMAQSRGGAGGNIVNLSSAAARLGSPHEYVDYAASKGAIDTLTVGLAKEVASEGIRVNAVRPGSIHTEIHAAGGEPDRVARIAKQVPLQRGGEPEEIADAILWLLSPQASYVTGALIDVTGGL